PRPRRERRLRAAGCWSRRTRGRGAGPREWSPRVRARGVGATRSNNPPLLQRVRTLHPERVTTSPKRAKAVNSCGTTLRADKHGASVDNQLRRSALFLLSASPPGGFEPPACLGRNSGVDLSGMTSPASALTSARLEAIACVPPPFGAGQWERTEGRRFEPREA